MHAQKYIKVMHVSGALRLQLLLVSCALTEKGKQRHVTANQCYCSFAFFLFVAR